MGILIANKGLSGRFKISGNSTGGFKARYVVPPTIDTDAQAFFDRVTIAGGTLSATEQTAITQLVSDLKSAGIWTAMKAVYPMVGASAAACAQNLKSNSFTGTFTSGWTFASTGAKGNGTSAYMDTNFNPNTSSTFNSKHLSYYSRNNFSECLMGANAGGLFDQIFYTGGAYYNILSTTSFVTTTTATTNGFLIVTRISTSGGRTTYVNNNNIGNDGLSALNNPNLNLYLNARNPAAGYSLNECAFASIGHGLSDTNASDFYTAVQAFQTTLGRQV